MNLSKMSDLELLQTYETFCYAVAFRHRIYEHEAKAKRDIEIEMRARMNHARQARLKAPGSQVDVRV